MNDAQRLTIGAAGTAMTWIMTRVDSLLNSLAPHAPTLAGLATAGFMVVSIADKFGWLDRFRRK